MVKKVQHLTYGDYISGRIHQCSCGELFVGQSNALHCSNACRVRVCREKKGDAYREANKLRMRKNRDG